MADAEVHKTLRRAPRRARGEAGAKKAPEASKQVGWGVIWSCLGGLSSLKMLTHDILNCELGLLSGPAACELQIIPVNTVPMEQVPLDLHCTASISKCDRGSLVNTNAIAIKILIFI